MIELPHLDGNGIAMNRLEQLRSWASSQLRETVAELTPASEDASFRRYFRIAHGAGTLIAMDAPPPHENCGRRTSQGGGAREAGARAAGR